MVNNAVAYPELVSGGVSKSRKFKCLVKVGANKVVTPDLKKIMAGGVSRQPENPPGYATEMGSHESLLHRFLSLTGSSSLTIFSI